MNKAGVPDFLIRLALWGLGGNWKLGFLLEVMNENTDRTIAANDRVVDAIDRIRDRT